MGIRIIYLGADQRFRQVRFGVKIQKEHPTLLSNTKDRIRHTLNGGPVLAPGKLRLGSFSELCDRPAPKSVPSNRQIVLCEENSFYPLVPGDGLINYEMEKYERRALQQEGAQAAKSRQSRLRESNVLAMVVSLASVATVAAIVLMLVLVVVSSKVGDIGNISPGDKGPGASSEITTEGVPTAEAATPGARLSAGL